MLAMLGNGAREAGAGQPAEPGALAGAAAVRAARGPMQSWVKSCQYKRRVQNHV